MASRHVHASGRAAARGAARATNSTSADGTDRSYETIACETMAATRAPSTRRAGRTMTSASIDVIAYALLATLTPLGFATTLAVIESGRLKALAFAVGFVAAQLTTCAVLVAVGATAAPRRDRDHPTFRAVLELLFGLALLALAAIVRRSAESGASQTSSRAGAVLERLRRLRVPTAFVAGLLLGVGGPKRLVLTTLAAASIA